MNVGSIPSTDEVREAWQDGRDDAAAIFPLVDGEGFNRGWDARTNDLVRRLRPMVAERPELRSLLIELLDG